MSAPPVRIESKAWTDDRFASLALRLGLTDADVAIIKVAKIWRWQTEHYTDDAPTYAVHRSVVEGALGSLQGPEALVAANLAELEPDGRLRIKGGRDGGGASRIDWLYRARQQRRAAGRSRAAGPREGGRFAPAAGSGSPPPDQRATSGPPAVDQREAPPTSETPAADQRNASGAPALRTPDSGSGSDVSLSAGARAGEPELARGTLPAIAPVAADRGRDLFAELAEELHQRHFREAERLKREVPGCATLAIGGGALMGERRQAVIALVSRWSAEARERGDDTAELVRRRMDHLVAVRSAAAIRDGHLRWWNAGTFWRPDSVDRDLAQTVVQAEQRASARGRDGPAARASPRADRGQAPVSKTAQRFDGDVPL